MGQILNIIVNTKSIVKCAGAELTGNTKFHKLVLVKNHCKIEKQYIWLCSGAEVTSNTGQIQNIANIKSIVKCAGAEFTSNTEYHKLVLVKNHL
jgi:hypothetical protein